MTKMMIMTDSMEANGSHPITSTWTGNCAWRQQIISMTNPYLVIHWPRSSVSVQVKLTTELRGGFDWETSSWPADKLIWGRGNSVVLQKEVFCGNRNESGRDPSMVIKGWARTADCYTRRSPEEITVNRFNSRKSLDKLYIKWISQLKPYVSVTVYEE